MFADELKSNAVKVQRLPNIITPNHMLVKVELSHEKVSPSGIQIGAVNSFSGTDSNGAVYTPAEHLPRRGTVIVPPSVLIFNPDYNNSIDESETLRWRTNIEVKEGDRILFSYLSGITSASILYKDELYYILKYDSVYAIDRDNAPVFINGYLGLTDVFEEQNGSLYIEPKIINHMGICEHISVPNLEYLNRFDSDDINISVGDLCYIKSPICDYRIYLESETYRTFPKKYFVYQRKDVLFVKN